MRRLAARAHLWGGLVSSPLLFVLGLSGSVLVFAPEIERLDRPGAHATASAVAPSLDAVVAAALVGQPGGEARALRVPTQKGGPFVVDVAVGGRRLDVAVDAATLRVVDARAPERSVITAVRSLHAAFHAGRAGALLVGLLGVWLVVESATGLWLYGPSIACRVRGRSRTIHRVVGVCALAVGAIVGFTGALLSVTALSDAGTMPTSPGRLARLHVVTARVPPGERIVSLTAASVDRVRIETRRPDGGVRALIIDADTGDIVTASASPGRWDIVRRLHGGDFAGWPSRLVFAAAGFALPVLSITGFLLAARRTRTFMGGR
jgi:uncharacterized iron-regulated membrane protein